MKVTDVWDKVDKSGMSGQSNKDINATLGRMSRGKFTLSEKFKMAVVGIGKEDMQELAGGAKRLIDNDFKGDAKTALTFLKDIEKTGIGQLDFSQLVRNGAVHSLVVLQKVDPDGFKNICAGKYADAEALRTALGISAAAGPERSPAMLASRPQSKLQRAPS